MTARSYEDLSLFTPPTRLDDIASLFNYLGVASRRLLVAPFGLRARLIEKIRATGQAAAEDARVRLKLNALRPMYRGALYRVPASEIEIVARSI